METIYIILIIVAVIAMFLGGMYNSLVGLRNTVRTSWSGIDIQLKRRFNLIPNLLKTVKGYAKHEEKLFTQISKDRKEMMNAANHGDMKKLAKGEASLAAGLKTIFALSENYPELKANENFMKFQEELTETEDQIAASRRIYNQNVNVYNTKIEMFPTNIFAGMFGFKASQFFEAVDEERKNPEVEF